MLNRSKIRRLEPDICYFQQQTLR